MNSNRFRKEQSVDISYFDSLIDIMVKSYTSTLFNNASIEYFHKHPDKKERIMEIPEYKIYQEIPELKYYMDAMTFEREIYGSKDKEENINKSFEDTVKKWCNGLRGPIDENLIKKTVESETKKMYYVNKILAEIVDEAKKSLESGDIENTKLAEFNEKCLNDYTPLNMEKILSSADNFRLFIIESCYDELNRKGFFNDKEEQEITDLIKKNIPNEINRGIQLL